MVAVTEESAEGKTSQRVASKRLQQIVHIKYGLWRWLWVPWGNAFWLYQEFSKAGNLEITNRERENKSHHTDRGIQRARQ